jgi:hypothetical protein
LTVRTAGGRGETRRLARTTANEADIGVRRASVFSEGRERCRERGARTQTTLIAEPPFALKVDVRWLNSRKKPHKQQTNLATTDQHATYHSNGAQLSARKVASCDLSGLWGFWAHSAQPYLVAAVVCPLSSSSSALELGEEAVVLAVRRAES